MPVKILLYSGFNSPRLHYILQWIMEEQLGVEWFLTSDKAYWKAFEGPKINYSSLQIADGELRILPHSLLQEDNITVQTLSVNRWKHSTIVFYNQPGAKIPFDIFAAAFYLLSRYEEYLPHTKDRHGRYQQEQSVAAQFSFLQEPVVDQWIVQFRKIIAQLFHIELPVKVFRFTPTYDIDMAWKYLYKGPRRQWGGLVKDFMSLRWKAVYNRYRTITGKQADPFDCFGWLDKVHSDFDLQPVYFMLLGQLTDYDKNADPHLPEMQRLMQKLAQHYRMGIHPSYKSHEDKAILQSEIKLLSDCIGQPVVLSRQHYIKFSLPETYEKLAAAGVTDDYSMGYATVNGFRAGTCNDFLWYNLKEEAVAALRIHPFAFMDATSKFYAGQSTTDAWMEWERLWHAVKNVNGHFICIWHNYILGTDNAYKGWRELYLKCLREL